MYMVSNDHLVLKLQVMYFFSTCFHKMFTGTNNGCYSLRFVDWFWLLQIRCMFFCTDIAYLKSQSCPSLYTASFNNRIKTTSTRNLFPVIHFRVQCAPYLLYGVDMLPTSHIGAVHLHHMSFTYTEHWRQVRVSNIGRALQYRVQMSMSTVHGFFVEIRETVAIDARLIG